MIWSAPNLPFFFCCLLQRKSKSDRYKIKAKRHTATEHPPNFGIKKIVPFPFLLLRKTTLTLQQLHAWRAYLDL
jgi:hypothetical protein